MAITKVLTEVPKVGRKLREPQHPFIMQHIPFQIVPIMCAPVLPGETMKNLLLQSRITGPAVNSPILGAWAEHAFFYVKLRDLASWATANGIRAMLMDSAVTLAGLGAADGKYYTGVGGFNFVKECMQAVVAEYFRTETEAWDQFQRGSYPLAAINNANWLDSAITAGSVTAPTAADYLPGDKPENEDTSLSPEYDAQYNAWAKMYFNGQTTLDYDDFLKSFGIKAPEIEREPESSKPELIRYVRSWKLPSVVVDGSGAANAAWQWEVQERADKARYFKEPGFVFGISVIRPKVYLKNVTGGMVAYLNNALQWLPAVLEQGGEFASLKQFAAGTGPAAGQTDGYWIDPRDLFLYGDQMFNVPTTATAAGLVALPTAAMQKRYAADADVDAMFKVGTNNFVTQDGVVKLSIAGRVREVTPQP